MKLAQRDRIRTREFTQKQPAYHASGAPLITEIARQGDALSLAAFPAHANPTKPYREGAGRAYPVGMEAAWVAIAANLLMGIGGVCLFIFAVKREQIRGANQA